MACRKSQHPFDEQRGKATIPPCPRFGRARRGRTGNRLPPTNCRTEVRPFNRDPSGVETYAQAGEVVSAARVALVGSAVGSVARFRRRQEIYGDLIKRPAVPPDQIRRAGLVVSGGRRREKSYAGSRVTAVRRFIPPLALRRRTRSARTIGCARSRHQPDTRRRTTGHAGAGRRRRTRVGSSIPRHTRARPGHR